MNTDRWRGVLLIVAIFTCGAITGAGFVQVRTTAKLRALISGPPGSLEPRVKLLLIERGLSLSRAQRERLEPVLQRFADQSRAVRLRVEPELAPIREDERAAVRVELNPEQRIEYDRRLEEIDRVLGRPAHSQQK